jgi:hypothetical protein
MRRTTIFPEWGVNFPAAVSNANDSIKADQAPKRQDFAADVGYCVSDDGNPFRHLMASA